MKEERVLKLINGLSAVYSKIVLFIRVGLYKNVIKILILFSRLYSLLLAGVTSKEKRE